MVTRTDARWRRGIAGVVAGTATCAAMAATAGEQPAPAPLFAAPFVVEHHVVQTEPDGTTSATEPVTDYYGGSWIVSVRPDGSRLVVDFARREVTEIRTGAATYSTLGFDRFAELNRRLRAGGGAAPSERDKSSSPAGSERIEAASGAAIQVQRLPDGGGGALSLHAAGAAGHGVMRMKVTAGAAASPIDVWCDPRVKISERARGAVAELESGVLGAGAGAPAAAAAMLAAARGYAQGAFPVRTVRRLAASGGATTIEDVATRLETVERFQMGLVRVPDGYRRVPHPLEVMVSFVEEEAAQARQRRATP